LGILWFIICENFVTYDHALNGETKYHLIDVYRGQDTFYIYDGYGFLTDERYFDSLTKVWYFGLTTLTTIGFGDFSPVSYHEKLIVAVILMVAVGVFSIIMANFLAIIDKRSD